MIFISSPYSHPDLNVVEERYYAAMKYFGWLMDHPNYKNTFSFSPVVHCHMPARLYSLPTTADHWRNYNAGALAICSYVHVLQIPGWDSSAGVAEEINAAKIMNKKLVAVTKDPDWDTYRLKPYEDN